MGDNKRDAGLAVCFALIAIGAGGELVAEGFSVWELITLVAGLAGMGSYIASIAVRRALR